MDISSNRTADARGEKMFAEAEFVVICAFCSRMRSGEGRWISLPLRLSQALQQETGRISHTYCPECVARHYPGTLNPNGSGRRG